MTVCTNTTGFLTYLNFQCMSGPQGIYNCNNSWKFDQSQLIPDNFAILWNHCNFSTDYSYLWALIIARPTCAMSKPYIRKAISLFLSNTDVSHLATKINDEDHERQFPDVLFEINATKIASFWSQQSQKKCYLFWGRGNWPFYLHLWCTQWRKNDFFCSRLGEHLAEHEGAIVWAE